jgi:CheY-like chemotaxis protein
VTPELGKLQAWYRQAMLKRIVELRDLRSRVEASDPEACDAARKVGQALRGSGATFGFPQLTAVATLVEISPNSDLLRRVEGLIQELGALTAEAGGEVAGHEWLVRAAGLAHAGAARLPSDLPSAWTEVARQAGVDGTGLAEMVAAHFSLGVADIANRTRAALRLVPEALVNSGRVVPLAEDSITITVATADPTALSTELELERLTGRKPIFAVAPPAAIEALIDELWSSGPSSAEGSVSKGRRGRAPTGEGNGVAAGAAAGPAQTVRAPAKPNRVRRRSHHAEPSLTDRAVLVVDDEPSARLLIRALLAKRGWSVFEASDGLEALDLMVENESIGLVVADLNMPKMDGLELIWELRDVHGWEHVPVIVVTGERDEILETQLMEEGADDYIRKPVDPRLFLARVESTIRRATE